MRERRPRGEAHGGCDFHAGRGHGQVTPRRGDFEDAFFVVEYTLRAGKLFDLGCVKSWSGSQSRVRDEGHNTDCSEVRMHTILLGKTPEPESRSTRRASGMAQS